MRILGNINESSSLWWVRMFLSGLVACFCSSQASAQESRVNYFYDDLDRLVRVIDENGNAATYHYDPVGNILRITREAGIPNTTVVTGLSSSSVTRGLTTVVTINGFNFSCSSVSVSVPGITISNTQISIDQVVLTVTVSSVTQVGSVDLQLNCDRQLVTVPVSVIDTPPTVSITSPTENAVLFEATNIILTAQAGDNIHVNHLVWIVDGIEFPPLFAPPYQQTVSVPFGARSVTIEARATDNSAQIGTATKTIAVQPDPGPAIEITSPVAGATLIEGQELELTASARDNRSVVTVVWKINGVSQPAIPIPPYRLTMTVPTQISSIVLEATATDDYGYTGSAVRTISVLPDPGTTVTGQVVNIDHLPVGGATVTVLDRFTAESQGDGSFSIPDVPTAKGEIAAVVNLTVGGTELEGSSVPAVPVAGGITNVGLVIVRPKPSGFSYPGIGLVTGDSPQSVLILDLNKDGHQDVITVNAASSDLSVLLGAGGGVFAPERRFTAGDGIGHGPSSLVAGDVNGDGNIDLVTSNTVITNTVSVLLGNGDGTFQAEQRLGVGRSPSEAAIGDLNGDGKLDIVSANFLSADLSVLLGNGDGTFQTEQKIPIGDGAASVTIADINGDGSQDLLVGLASLTDLAILLGNGDGTFGPMLQSPAGLFVQYVRVGDLNGDGKADLAVGPRSFFSSNSIATMLGNGDGTFQTPQPLMVGNAPMSLALTDLNLDGNLDILTPNFGSADVSILLGHGDGSFEPQQRIGAVSSPYALAVARINSDSNLDLVVTSATAGGPVAIFFGNPDGTFQSRQALRVGSRPEAVVAADFNVDGKLDIITANSSSNDLSILFGNGDGSFQIEQRVQVGRFPSGVAAAHLDADGIPDIISTNSNDNDVSIILSNNGGTQSRYGVGSFPVGIAVADFNSDGKADIITANRVSFDISVLLGNGDGTFLPERRFAGTRRSRSLAIADLNADGRLDVVVAGDDEFDDNVAVLVGNGDGTFQPPQLYIVGAGTRGIFVQDVNDDQKADIIAANAFDDNIAVLLGHGDGTFQPRQLFSAGDGPMGVAVVDVDSDGKQDVVISNNNVIAILLGDGDGTFIAPQFFVTAGSSRSLVVADFNGDGKPDVATADNLRNQVSVLLHR